MKLFHVIISSYIIIYLKERRWLFATRRKPKLRRVLLFNLWTRLEQNDEAVTDTKKPKPCTHFTRFLLILTLTTDKSLLLPHNWINWQTNGFPFTNGTCPCSCYLRFIYSSKNVPFNAYVTPIFVNTNNVINFLDFIPLKRVLNLRE